MSNGEELEEKGNTIVILGEEFRSVYNPVQ